MSDENILKKIGDGIVDIAPTIGSILTASVVGAPAGAAVKALGTLGKALGLGSEAKAEDIQNAIVADPEARLKIMLAENNFNLEILKQETITLQAINETMRAESLSEHWPQYSWRPFWGFASGLAFFFVCVLVCLLSWQAVYGKDASALGTIPLIIGAFATLFSIPGTILGIASWKRGQMQISKTSKYCN